MHYKKIEKSTMFLFFATENLDGKRNTFFNMYHYVLIKEVTASQDLFLHKHTKYTLNRSFVLYFLDVSFL